MFPRKYSKIIKFNKNNTLVRRYEY